ncbi:hypothetical protein [Glutamicibacter protophormiae]|uniref:Sterol desaturase/sphingolipid hydroxylase (Fatty acid hydroxylase superfamily) n=1 Tax=Glutamicibacter protophormiae TaxID=37930 RepID=A0ABS4XRF3_GLUPR|nr:hypothetical protein [Glutamicibacter protophormiae]MBP2399098.1 sterol desaturase/sphingolipid hydroxylase (fatty acid hydroxylase superfamily) [Glutamicibacter protophormiae]QRQ79733.1 hypothetical protein JQN66_05825 [Glutamicibacter protophormiae]GGL96273.1 hypothetical protein GCM10010038_28200 [Glutamicibacter protophormiae]
MNYERNLTFNLRMQGMPESEIAETLKEVRSHEATTGASAEAEFGPAEEYAKQFPKRKRRTKGRAIVTAGLMLAVAYLLFAFLGKPLAGIDIRDYVGPLVLLPAVAIIAVGMLLGFLVDYFQPARSA